MIEKEREMEMKSKGIDKKLRSVFECKQVEGRAGGGGRGGVEQRRAREEKVLAFVLCPNELEGKNNREKSVDKKQREQREREKCKTSDSFFAFERMIFGGNCDGKSGREKGRGNHNRQRQFSGRSDFGCLRREIKEEKAEVILRERERESQ
jgi:hypothetical protein